LKLILQIALSKITTALSTNGTSDTNPVDNRPEVHNPLNISDKGLILRQQQVMKEQDKVLLDIEKGVDRLHQQVN